MDDLQKINQLINEKYHLENIMPLSRINKDNIDNILAVYTPQVNRECLLNPANKDKYLIQFRDLKKKFKRIELITGDRKAINKAHEYQAYLNQPLGVSIHATCVAMGSASSEQMVSHLDRLIPSLGDIFGWKFELIDRTGAFNANIKINSTDRIKKSGLLKIFGNF